MGSISNYSENKWLDHFTGEASYTPPTIYVGLSTADPGDDAAGLAEPSGGAYARVAHSSWDTAATRLTENTGAITFPQATAAWGTITHWALFDAATSGNMLAHGALNTSKVVSTDNTPSIADGEIEVSVNASGSGGGWTDFLVHEMLDHVFGNGSYTAPSIYLALSTTTPTDSGPNVTEPSGNNYSRIQHSNWDTAASGATENTGTITFATPSGSWGACTHAAAFDASSAGNCLFWIDVPNNTPDNGDTVSFADGALDLTLS